MSSQRKVAIAVDLSDESAYAVQWAVQNYLRPNDSVILLHVQPTSVLYGADWGPPPSVAQTPFDLDSFTAAKAKDIAKPLVDGNIEFRIHIVKDHDMKERLCLEVERLGLKGFGSSLGTSSRVSGKKLGSVSGYCVQHCVCPVVVVRFPDDGEVAVGSPLRVGDRSGGGLFPVPEEEPEFHDASDKQTGESVII
ncbi:adenine nucleotide alpha hydrolases-like superfamily protein [Artemisia annua]|uniref:Adenine nucleotide alpha hydrolases-like superfamily protein n=1 Tax=Artemisia annua TaxID=35608 RepID=A0A2U1N8C2_ARTAN|nr:adenine nucleotide alpha hydrolases-like superfamily protein [Artemisia annua]